MLKEDRKSIDVTEKLAKDRRQKKRPSGKKSFYYLSIVRLSDIFYNTFLQQKLLQSEKSMEKRTNKKKQPQKV